MQYPLIYKLMRRGLLPRIKVYDDTLNDRYYVCDAKHGALLTDAVWRVQKLNKDGTGETEEEFETAGYNNAVPNLAAVQALTYL